MRKIQCKRCGHPEAKRGTAVDGRPRYTCTKCGETWTQGYPDSKRRRKWYALTGRANVS